MLASQLRVGWDVTVTISVMTSGTYLSCKLLAFGRVTFGLVNPRGILGENMAG
jgi:hypothetical protein